MKISIAAKSAHFEFGFHSGNMSQGAIFGVILK